ncbi:heme/hemin ABC transporter substrate-binding protein [Cellulomonas phragmiteti]|uniref:ABC transporter substrate-binding protein n=1 Tax=Cellulomonas phragmiteti TaxID=478780 RepID=A0ABQ4DLW2_9CELL|nr:ABC transporter substrate-binding protein [Cellulomonas phragmiteti]GIG40336.1 ABC transporter substrate-binding protein [Cellulomonas phragmiteti]
MRARATRALRVTVTALLVAATAACGTVHDATAGAPDGGRRLADVTPVADPRAVTGPSTAVVADSAVRPVVADPAPALPVTVTDLQGTQVTVTDVDRILALDVHGTLARTVFELGLGDRVVGRDVSSGFAEIADLPLVTAGGHDLSGEAILALGPTVLLTDTSLGPWDVVLQVREAGIPVVVVDPHRDVQGVGALVREVAAALGVPDAGELLAQRAQAEIDDRVARIAAVAPADPADRLRVAFLYARGQAGVYYLFGEGSGADALIEAVGAVDVAREIGWQGMRPVTDEGLVAAAPDVVLMMSDGLASVGGVDGLLERLPAVASTPAGQRRRVVDMADSQVLSFGPTTADVLDALAVALYAPDAS